MNAAEYIDPDVEAAVKRLEALARAFWAEREAEKRANRAKGPNRRVRALWWKEL